MSESEILREILDIYEKYNPFFNYLILEARRKIIPYLHQVEFTARTMLRRPLRTLIADEIGLGKTITALVVLRKMWKLGIVKKILILVPRILVRQWIMELRRMGFDRWIKRIERNTINYLVYEGFSDGVYVASMDLVKREPYFQYVKKIDWDIIIIDEVHRLGKDTERFRKLGEGLVGSFPDRHALFLSATPHRGDPEDYISRLRILDPYLLSGRNLDNIKFYSLTHNVLIFRRSKIDVNDLYEGRKIFTDCQLEAIVTSATEEEQEYHTLLIRFLRTKVSEFYEKIGREAKALGLLTALIFKRASSSPYAAMRTMENMLRKRAEFLRQIESKMVSLEEYEEEASSIANAIFGLSFDDYSDYYEDVSLEPDEVLNRFAAKCSIFLSEEDEKTLRRLSDLAKKISENDSRLKTVKLLVKAYLEQGRKVIVFSEYKDTVNYVYNSLVNELGKDAVVRMTSDEVGDERKFISIRRRFEKDSQCKVMVATDVASEGLNLQVASVVINYEIPWSPIKLEQRMGRVWRLGQTRDVIINTIFIAVENDKDVLDIIYRKLIAMGRSVGIRKPLVGEEAIFIDMKSKQIPLQLVEVSRNKKKKKFSEHTLITEYLLGGREALNEMVEAIIRTINRLKEDLRRYNIFPMIDKTMLRKFIKDCTGFNDSQEVFNVLEKLLKTVLNNAKRRGLKLEYDYNKDRLIIIARGGTPIGIEDPVTAYRYIKKILEYLSSKTRRKVPYIVAYEDIDADLYIYKTSIVLVDKQGNENILYSEPVGVLIDKDGLKIVRGSELLNLICRAINRFAFEVDEYRYDLNEDDKLRILSMVKEFGQELMRKVSLDFWRYRDKLSRYYWRDRRDNWAPDLRTCTARTGNLIGIIKFTSEREAEKERTIDPLTRKRIELKAMRISLNYEKNAGREAIDVSDKEHFDILSRDPNTGEVRYIEVKGHAGPSMVAELSEEEYRVALEKGEKYWLYIVYNVETDNPQLTAIRNPIKNMKVIVKERKTYCFKPYG
ncbi:MAG TPA: DUF3883 domain-containing protein [Thermoprotei archaeon]|nr:DUF3883 domain-containing protein [Thermoprotei archaeon]